MRCFALFLLQKVKFEEIRKNCSYIIIYIIIIIIMMYNYIRTIFSYFFKFDFL